MADDDKKNDARTVKLTMRISFPDSLKDKKATVEGGTPKHSVNLINETDQPHFAANDKKIKAAIEAACEKFWKNKDKHIEIADDNPQRICYREGRRFKNKETGKVYVGYENNWAISAGTPGGGQKRPKMLDRHKREVAEADILDVIYPGTYADVIVSFYGTDKGGNGVFCTVEAIRSRQEGAHMGGGVNVSADDFDDLEEDDAFSTGGSTAPVDDLLA